MDYNKRELNPGTSTRIFVAPKDYETNFTRFTHVTDLFIAGHFYGDGAPAFF